MADSGIERSHGSSLLPQSYSKSYMNKNNMMMTNENQYERTRNFYPAQTRHRDSVSNSNDSYTRDKSSFNANQEKTGIPTPSGPSSSSSFYSAPTTTNAVNFQYDVLLIYDPDTDFYAAQDLVKQIEHQQLRIFDFARDCPAGGAQRHFLEKALETSRYICIVVTRNFISNFWLKFKTDMAIQFMLQNEHMHYSVIVVVMDRLLKQHDLPLDLQTLTPIFLSSPFYEIKISRAFGFTESTFSTAGRSNLCNSPT
uniref:TIR domain-containing protein n=1 Tax=Ciona savignyi TaxID=51511 RepID=H2Z8U3_CIOSA